MSEVSQESYSSARMLDFVEFAQKHGGGLFNALDRYFNYPPSEQFHRLVYERRDDIPAANLVVAHIDGNPNATHSQREWSPFILGVDATFARLMRREAGAIPMLGFVADGITRAALLPPSNCLGYDPERKLETWSQRRGRRPLNPFMLYQLPDGSRELPPKIEVVEGPIAPREYDLLHPNTPMY